MSSNQIVLTSGVHTDEVAGDAGQVIDVTEDNAARCSELLKLGSAQPFAEQPARTTPAAGDPSEDDDDDDSGLTDDPELLAHSAVEALLEFGVPKRFVSALSESGLATIDQVQAHSDLAGIKGMSTRSQAHVLEVINKNLANAPDETPAAGGAADGDEATGSSTDTPAE